MKKSIALSIIAAFLLLVSFTLTNSITWSVDNAHSRLGFMINHLGIADVNGSFGTFETKIITSKPDFSDAMVELSGDISSISTGNSMRDDHLKTPDFLMQQNFQNSFLKAILSEKTPEKTIS
jgi:polyisoprenoid-binding protein YceI